MYDYKLNKLENVWWVNSDCAEDLEKSLRGGRCNEERSCKSDRAPNDLWQKGK